MLNKAAGGKILSLTPWSRILSDNEIVVAINTGPDANEPPGSPSMPPYTTRTTP